MSIQDMWEQSKEKINEIIRDDTVFTALLLVVVSVTSFGLGRLAERAIEPVRSPQSATVVVSQATSTVPEYVIASKNGTKYHLPWCAGAQQISEENKIRFESSAAAKQAGYAPAANCPGLK